MCPTKRSEVKLNTRVQRSRKQKRRECAFVWMVESATEPQHPEDGAKDSYPKYYIAKLEKENRRSA